MNDDATTDASTDDDQAGARAGIACPRCSVRLLVTVTRDAAPGLRVRYLVCPRCRLRGRTDERLTRTFEPDDGAPA